MSGEIRQEDIDRAIKTCYWRKNIGGVSICGGMLTPCERLIDRGECDTLIQLFKGGEKFVGE